jgi:predicted DNA-binding protein
VNRRSDWFAMRLSREEREQLKLLAERENTSFSAAVRGAIRKAIEMSEPREEQHTSSPEARWFISGV